MSELIGRTIGQYQVERVLGAGGMGQVFQARHEHLEIPRAVKVMHPHLGMDPRFRQRFLREGRASASLRHPNIVETFDFGEADGRLYLVMELVPDGSLRSLLRDGERLPLGLGLDLVRQAAEGLAYAHAQGVFHRDIKPDNLLLRWEGEPGAERYTLKISDFGLADLTHGSVLTSTGVLTPNGAALGTPAYISPEQCLGADVDGRSDLYSLGIVLYEVATGCLPFQVKSLSDAVHKHVYEPPPPPREVSPDLPSELEALILRCLAKQPDARFASVAEFAAALRGVSVQGDFGTWVPPLRVDATATPVSPTPDGIAPVVPRLSEAATVPRVRVLDATGGTVQILELTRRGLTVGRLPDNDLVLDKDAVSRHHLRLDWDGSRATATDLGSTNGTLLEGDRIPPRAPQALASGSMLRVGPYWLRFEAPTGAVESSTARGLVTSGGRIGIVLDRDTLTLAPSQPATLRATVANLGATVDHLKVSVQGVPEHWLDLPPEVKLPPGDQASVSLTVNVPRHPDSRAGDHPVTVSVRSTQNPKETAAVSALWKVLPFSGSSLDFKPARAAGWRQARYNLVLRNEGNVPATYRLGGTDEEQALSFRFDRQQVALDPGGGATVRLDVGARLRWFGTALTRPFKVDSRPTESPPASSGPGPQSQPEAPRTVAGQFVHRAVIPTWLPPAVVVLAGLAAFLVQQYTHTPKGGGTQVSQSRQELSSLQEREARLREEAAAAAREAEKLRRQHDEEAARQALEEAERKRQEADAAALEAQRKQQELEAQLAQLRKQPPGGTNEPPPPPPPPPDELVELPDLHGMTVDEVKQATAGLDLEVQVKARQPNATVLKDGIISQDPAPGTRVKTHSRVRVTVSSGPEMVVVPDLKGKTLQEAQTLAQGLDIREGERKHDNTVLKDRILSHVPAAGEQAPKRSAITVTLSDGPEMIVLPPLRGKTLTEAQALLPGLKIVETSRRSDRKAPKDQILLQIPHEGETVAVGGTVQVIVSSGSSMVTLPGLRGKTVAEAQAMLPGLKIAEISRRPDPSLPQGQILVTIPPEGETMAAGGTVRVIVSSGAETVTVPDLRNKTVAEAGQAARGLVFVREVARREASPTVPVGGVIRHDPPAGAAVPKNSTVWVTVSSGPSVVRIPALRGKTVAEAQSVVPGLRIIETSRRPDPSFSKDQIITQFPLEGETLPAGGTVRVTVSSGAGPGPGGPGRPGGPGALSGLDSLDLRRPAVIRGALLRNLVPDFQGEKYEPARAAGMLVGLQVRLRSRPGVGETVIMWQSVEPGTPITPNLVVRVELGPPPGSK